MAGLHPIGKPILDDKLPVLPLLDEVEPPVGPIGHIVGQHQAQAPVAGRLAPVVARKPRGWLSPGTERVASWDAWFPWVVCPTSWECADAVGGLAYIPRSRDESLWDLTQSAPR